MIFAGFLFNHILPFLGVLYIVKVTFRLARGHGAMKAFL